MLSLIPLINLGWFSISEALKQWLSEDSSVHSDVLNADPNGVLSLIIANNGWNCIIVSQGLYVIS